VPIGAWFRGDLKDFLVSSLTRSNSFCSNFLKKERIGALIREHTSGQLNHQKKLWMLLNLELWHDRFMVN